jgi:phenylpropionate dioxygenase-like ring-hydroxylating dioxygenase large terminal subunit
MIYTAVLLSSLTIAVFAFVMKLLWSYFWSRGMPNPSPESNTTTRALPAVWYRSEELYALERRAIFSKRWLLVSHKLRFPNNGDWLKLEQAGFTFIIVKDRKGTIRGFHNVCRHRAFPVVTEDSGQSRIFSCRYHGWSYGLDGSLSKAPGYQDMKGFDADRNGLLPIHVKVDSHGFIWVNLDAHKVPEVAWEDDFRGIDQQARHESFNFDDYRYDHTWGMSGDYNWKTLADNYNECYHCATAHPDARAVAILDAYRVETKGGNVEHFALSTPEQEKAGMKVVSNFYFPNACMSVT